MFHVPTPCLLFVSWKRCVLNSCLSALGVEEWHFPTTLPESVVEGHCVPQISARVCTLCKKHVMLCHKSVSSLASAKLMHMLCPLTDLNPKQHVPVDEYAANLKSMIQYLKSVDITEDRIILITPPPLHESAWEKECLAKGKRMIRVAEFLCFTISH